MYVFYLCFSVVRLHVEEVKQSLTKTQSYIKYFKIITLMKYMIFLENLFGVIVNNCYFENRFLAKKQINQI